VPVSVLSTSLITDPKRYGRFNALNTVYLNPGMVLLTPTSINHTGTSASIGSNGQVTFTAVTALSLNGVFSADFDNYIVSMRFTTSAGADIQFRYRSSGSDNSSANSYVRQQIFADGATVQGVRVTDNLSRMATGFGTQRAGTKWLVYGPYLAEPTADRNVSSSDYLSAYLVDYATTHNVSSSYDGFTLFPSGTVNMTGALQVYGVRS